MKKKRSSISRKTGPIPVDAESRAAFLKDVEFASADFVPSANSGSPNALHCRRWIGTFCHSYGLFCFGGRQEGAHRFAYRCTTGAEIPKGFVIDHLCNNKWCVAPSHLELVTASENTKRAIRQGRGMYGLTPVERKQRVSDVAEFIIAHWDSERRVGEFMREIDSQFGVSQTLSRKMIEFYESGGADYLRKFACDFVFNPKKSYKDRYKPVKPLKPVDERVPSTPGQDAWSFDKLRNLLDDC